jgi:hypothetical protein
MTQESSEHRYAEKPASPKAGFAERQTKESLHKAGSGLALLGIP